MDNSRNGNFLRFYWNTEQGNVSKNVRIGITGRVGLCIPELFMKTYIRIYTPPIRSSYSVLVKGM